MSNAIHAQGTKIKRGDGATPEVFTTISEALTITGPGLDSDLIDVTNHDSPTRFREKIQGLKDAGQISFDINYNPVDPTHDAATGVLADYVSGAKANYQLVFPDPAMTTWTFEAFVKQASPTEDVAEQLKLSVVLEVTGQPTLA